MEDKKIFCNNCGKVNHEYKECKNPVTSYGVILINLDDKLEKYKDKLIEIFNNNDDIYKLEPDELGICANTEDDIMKFSECVYSMKFLMIQRKHTLGYIEFIRGRYKTDNIDGIIYLFQQMTKDEITNIENHDFDYLWMTFWGERYNNPSIQLEFDKSKEKFMILKNDEELKLDYFIQNVVPLWEYSEWGFPKGRRNRQEDNIICAIREFEEESNFKNTEYTILKNIYPLIEDFVGTNGVKYRHVYYIALSHKTLLDNTYQCNEIKDIHFYNYEEAIKIIRPYHVAKKKVLTRLYLFIMNFIISNAL